MCQNTKRAAGNFISQRVGISEFRIFSVLRTGDKIEALGWIPATEAQKSLRGSGFDGVQVRPFVDTDADRSRFKVIVLEGEDRLEVFATAKYLGERAFGIVHTRRGWAIRVLSTEYPALV